MTGSTRYFIKAGYEERCETRYFDDVPDGVIWQPDVYEKARDLARALDSKRIVDVGCGNGCKLVAFHPEFDVVGIDYRANLQLCRERYPYGLWLEHDLETTDKLPLTPDGWAHSIIICSDVIEHLLRPERLLGKLRIGLDHADALVLSTPERDLTRGVGHNGPPPNVAHVREWAAHELAAFLGSAGFQRGDMALTRANERENELKTILAVMYRDADAEQRAHARSGATTPQAGS